MKKTLHYKGHRWSNDELVKLMQLWANETPIIEIANSLKSTQIAILKQVQRMRKDGIPLSPRRKGHTANKSNSNWTQGEAEYLIRRRNEKATSGEIAIELERTPNAVDAMIQKLRKENVNVAMRGCGVRRLWDAESLKIMTTNKVFGLSDVSNIDQVS